MNVCDNPLLGQIDLTKLPACAGVKSFAILASNNGAVSGGVLANGSYLFNRINLTLAGLLFGSLYATE